MTSSEYSSSDEDTKPNVSDDSDASSKKHKKRPTRNTSSKAIIESAGSSDSDDSDSDRESDSDGGRAAASRKRKGSVSMNKKGGASSSAKRKRTMSEESDRGEMDDDLFADEEDRRQVMSMNEKDREQEIFNRMEQQEMRRTRKQIEEKLAAAKNASSGGGDKKERKEKRKREDKKRINDADSDDGKSQPSRSKDQSGSKSKGAASESESEADMKFHRPSEIHKKATQKNAMADLLAKRKDKENKAAKKAALSIDAVFGKDDSDGSSSSSSSSSSTASSRSSSRESSPRRDAESEDEEEKKAARREVETVSELSRARISRYKIAKIVYAPFFAKTVIGCFVRIGLGSYGGKSKYRLSQIVDVVEMNKVYTFENLKTNKGLKLKYGTDERVFRIEFVSNAQFGEEEFSEWRTVTKEECGSLPTMDHIEKKELDIRKAMNFNYTDEVIEYIVKEKKKFSDKVKNFAVTKGELMKKKVRSNKY
nr:Plus-3 domain containing protein [Haemonchus contortus]